MRFKKYTEEQQLEMVQESGFAIRFITNPSEEVQLAAVKQNGWALIYIPEFNEEIYQVAKKHGYMRNEDVFIEYEKLRPKKVVEHTLEELEELLGYEVKIKKENRK